MNNLLFLSLTRFFIGDCAYIQMNKDQYPNNYTIRKIINSYDNVYVYQYTNNPEDIKRQLYAIRDKDEFNKEETRMVCPGWFK